MSTDSRQNKIAVKQLLNSKGLDEVSIPVYVKY
jgi:hypothetical protein